MRHPACPPPLCGPSWRRGLPEHAGGGRSPAGLGLEPSLPASQSCALPRALPKDKFKTKNHQAIKNFQGTQKSKFQQIRVRFFWSQNAVTARAPPLRAVQFEGPDPKAGGIEASPRSGFLAALEEAASAGSGPPPPPSASLLWIPCVIRAAVNPDVAVMACGLCPSCRPCWFQFIYKFRFLDLVCPFLLPFLPSLTHPAIRTFTQ